MAEQAGQPAAVQQHGATTGDDRALAGSGGDRCGAAGVDRVEHDPSVRATSSIASRTSADSTPYPSPTRSRRIRRPSGATGVPSPASRRLTRTSGSGTAPVSTPRTASAPRAWTRPAMVPPEPTAVTTARCPVPASGSRYPPRRTHRRRRRWSRRRARRTSRCRPREDAAPPARRGRRGRPARSGRPTPGGPRAARRAAGCPCCGAGGSPARTSVTSSPSRAPAAAVRRAWLLWAAPLVTTAVAP